MVAQVRERLKIMVQTPDSLSAQAFNVLPSTPLSPAAFFVFTINQLCVRKATLSWETEPLDQL